MDLSIANCQFTESGSPLQLPHQGYHPQPRFTVRLGRLNGG